jgi:DNA-binding NtrC family response regulator
MPHDDTLAARASRPQFREQSHAARPSLGAVVDVSFNEARARFERNYLDQVLQNSAGNLSQAARLAGMDRSNFRRLLDRHGIRPNASSGALRPNGARR